MPFKGTLWKGLNMNKKKMFIISDIHGYYDEMIKALEKAGYNENNDEHKLICLGDIFDRGAQSLAVYEYLKRLSDEDKAIVLSGNHSLFLIQFLQGS